MQACCTSVALILWKETIEPYFILVLHLMAELQRNCAEVWGLVQKQFIKRVPMHSIWLRVSPGRENCEKVRDAITAELVEALKGEKEEALSTACDGLRRAVGDTKQWCAARNAAQSLPPSPAMPTTALCPPSLTGRCHVRTTSTLPCGGKRPNTRVRGKKRWVRT